MPAPEAAHYLGVSESMLRQLDLPRRMLGAKRLYDRFDLDAYASSLPIEGES
ncbi:helix-turn-helix domain-containing protein [Rhodobacter aestuarii]|nr:helix-turn-helix domain-containing protein [Rhodobacter aestuarii]